MSEQTIKDSFLKYRAQIEAGTSPKTLTAAFAAGARAVLESLGDPFGCPVCITKILEITQQIEEFHPMNNGGLERKLESGAK